MEMTGATVSKLACAVIDGRLCARIYMHMAEHAFEGSTYVYLNSEDTGKKNIGRDSRVELLQRRSWPVVTSDGLAGQIPYTT